jgi:hypothetical protein
MSSGSIALTDPSPAPPSGAGGTSLADLLAALRGTLVAERVWPPHRRTGTLLDLLQRYDPAAEADRKRTMVIAEAVSHVPIIAVAGLNDQGKSSLVASFLSPENAARVLRGARLEHANW